MSGVFTVLGLFLLLLAGAGDAEVWKQLASTPEGWGVLTIVALLALLILLELAIAGQLLWAGGAWLHRKISGALTWAAAAKGLR